MNTEVDYTIVPNCSYNNIHLGAACGYVGILLIWGVYLAYKSRSMPSKFNETLPLLIVLGFILCYGLLIIPLQFMLASNPDEVVILRACGIVLGLWVCVGAIYIPKLLQIYDNPDKGASTSADSTGGSAGKKGKGKKGKGKASGSKKSTRKAGTSGSSNTSRGTSNVSKTSTKPNPAPVRGNDNIPVEYEEEEYSVEYEEYSLQGDEATAIPDNAAV